LLTNAIKYTDEGRVRLEAALEQTELTLRVRDTGIGIPGEHLEQVFEPFWRVDAGRRGGAEGAGLGLSIVRRLVALLGGEISVESEVGRGSAFTVRLPEVRVPGS
jgi:signal transduction histidine kinase